MNFLEKALNFIFPPVCGVCGKLSNQYLCDECNTKLVNSDIFLNQLEDYSNNKDNFINEHLYLFSYEGIIREKILQYKFRDNPYLANTFSEFFVKNEKVCGFLKKYDIMGAIPIAASRKRERGYNQSQIIAKNISKTQKVAFENQLLIKIKNNQPQSSLNKKQRLENVKNVYKVQNVQKIENKKIVLFDDIYTTGATASECAKVLKQAGAKYVGIITIAKDLKNIKLKIKE